MALPDFTDQTIKATFQRLIQTPDGVTFFDGTGSAVAIGTTDTGSLLDNASAALNTITFTRGDSSTFDVTVDTGSASGTTDTGSLLDNASSALNVLTFTRGDATTFNVTVDTGSASGTTDTGSLLDNASSTLNVLTFTRGDSSTFNVTVDTGSAATVDTGSLLDNASAAQNVLTFTRGDATTFDVTVATGSAATVDTGSLLDNASAALNVLTFTRGDATTFDVTVNTGSAATVDTGSLLDNASAALNVLTFTRGDATTFDVTVNTGSAATPLDTGSFIIDATNSPVSVPSILFARGDGTAYTVSTLNPDYDDNFVAASAVLNVITFTDQGGLTHNVTVDTGSAATVDTGSLLDNASAALNVLTFTRGDATTFNVTVDTGSAGGGDVMVSGTPAVSEIAVWTSADTIEGYSRFTFNTSTDVFNINGRTQYEPGVAGTGELFYATVEMESAVLVSTGDILRVGIAITTVQHNLYDFSNGTWVAADADAGNTSQGLLGIAVAAGTTNTFLTKGYFNTTSYGGTAAVGGALYVGNVAGSVSFQKPIGIGDTVRQIGYCVDSYTSGRTTYYKMYFDPSMDFTVL
tara:strand:- start:7641 stop:9377 length:1737 start_codon:yes stop_codon:yes gene_type:complete